jgi:hypothetical protein
MVLVAVVPVRDDDGNVLVDVRFVAESDLGMWERRLPMPASLIVVRFGDSVLMVFDLGDVALGARGVRDLGAGKQ